MARKRALSKAVLILPLLGSLGLLIGWTQSPDSPADSQGTAQATIRVESDLVLVPVSVTDASRRPVKDLAAQDFQIAEDGTLQEIASMQEPGRSSVELALLIDISGSVASRFDFEQKAGADFVRSVASPQKNISIFTIGPRPGRVSDPSNDPTRVIDALMSVRPRRDATAFYDTLAEAAGFLRRVATPFSRRVQIVITDGEDNYSLKYGLDSALRELQRADCMFYSINPAKSSVSINVISRRAQNNLEYLALQTGGEAFLPDDWSELPSIYSVIAADLQAQYLLGYYSSRTVNDGAFRRISVTIPQRPDLRIRARQGYFVPTQGQIG